MRAAALAASASGTSRCSSSVSRAEKSSPSACSAVTAAFAPEATTIAFSPWLVDADEGRPGGRLDARDMREVHAVLVEKRERDAGEGVLPHRADQHHLRPARRAARAWFAPLPPGITA